jgi:hypothetical protein
MMYHSHHVRDLQNFVGNLNGASLRSLVEEEKAEILMLVLHAADIGNFTYPVAVAQPVAQLVIREFLAQVEQEKGRGLPVTTFMAGYSDPVYECKQQRVFIDVVVSPLWNAVTALTDWREPLDHLDENKAAYSAKEEMHRKSTAQT